MNMEMKKMGINIEVFVKYSIILLFSSFCFFSPLYPAEVNPEKINSPILNPDVSNPADNEKNGQKLKVIFNSQHKIINEKGSARYYNLKYDNEKKLINCAVSSSSGSSDYSWKIINTDNTGDYTIRGWRSGTAVFTKERKPLKIEYNPKRTNQSLEDIFIDQGKFYIPEINLKPGDEWGYYFTDTAIVKRDSDSGSEEPKYYKIEVKAVFKLAGYKDYENTRAAVITSEIRIRKVFVLLYKKENMKVKGGTLIYDITAVNQLLIDYNTGWPLYCTTGILKKVKGTLHDNWGKTPGEAEMNVLDEYNGFINENETNYTIYYIRYIDKSKNIVKPADEK